ncbi:hypothetical protein ACFFMN_41610 [Planobispora siamensis]|uniref:hypothetical protein n=1 Tax=Planobispora siamensis TaxID=936338 RepID=UPI0019527048|nr:hypothetical protein [Planobispora siamensis]
MRSRSSGRRVPVLLAVLPLAAAPVLAASPAAGTHRTAPAPGSLGGCPNLPADNVWHSDVSRLPAHPSSRAYVSSIGASKKVKADFGSGLWEGAPIGIPVTYVRTGQAKVPVSFEYRSESDPGPYPVPRGAAIEGGPSSDGDRHVLVVDTGACKLYELYSAYPSGKGWKAGSGAVFDLRSNKLRPAGWTSADAAGLPVAPGLVRYEEVAAGRIDHAIRVTVPRSQRKYLWPARHFASNSGDAALPPMGLRLRLKAGVNTGALPPQARVIAEAMKKHGLIVADNGSAWYISGTPDSRWDNDQLRRLGTLRGSDFEAVDTGSLMVAPDSGAARR